MHASCSCFCNWTCLGVAVLLLLAKTSSSFLLVKRLTYCPSPSSHRRKFLLQNSRCGRAHNYAGLQFLSQDDIGNGINNENSCDDTDDDNEILLLPENNDDDDDNSVDDNHNGHESTPDALFLERFKRQRRLAEASIWEERKQRPPYNTDLDPYEVVTSILESLRNPHAPTRNFGFQILWEASTPRWQNVLARSIGAPAVYHEYRNGNPANSSHDDTSTSCDGLNHDAAQTQLSSTTTNLAAALGAAMSRPRNQFRILVGKENNPFQNTFPTECIDYQDGTCWVECRLRSVAKNVKPSTKGKALSSSSFNYEDDQLLVAIGWSLVKMKTPLSVGSDISDTASWRVDGMDWQDFREAYRPGIGREEWERICG